MRILYIIFLSFIFSISYAQDPCEPNTACDDGNECTINDRWDEDCNCISDPLNSMACNGDSPCNQWVGEGKIVCSELDGDSLKLVLKNENGEYNEYVLNENGNVIDSYPILGMVVDSFFIDGLDVTKKAVDGTLTYYKIPASILDSIPLEGIQQVSQLANGNFVVGGVDFVYNTVTNNEIINASEFYLFLYDSSFTPIKHKRYSKNYVGFSAHKEKIDSIYNIVPLDDGNFDVFWAESENMMVYQTKAYLSRFDQDLKIIDLHSFQKGAVDFQITPCNNYLIDLNYVYASHSGASRSEVTLEFNPNQFGVWKSNEWHDSSSFGSASYKKQLLSEDWSYPFPSWGNYCEFNQGLYGVDTIPKPIEINVGKSYLKLTDTIPHGNYYYMHCTSDQNILLFAEEEGKIFINTVGCEEPDLIVKNIQVITEEDHFFSNGDTMKINVEIENRSNVDINTPFQVNLKLKYGNIFDSKILENIFYDILSITAKQTITKTFEFILDQIDADGYISATVIVDVNQTIEEKYEVNNALGSSSFDCGLCNNKPCDDGNDCTYDALNEACECIGTLYNDMACNGDSPCNQWVGEGKIVCSVLDGDKLNLVLKKENGTYQEYILNENAEIIDSNEVAAYVMDSFFIDGLEVTKKAINGDLSYFTLPDVLLDSISENAVQQVVQLNNGNYVVAGLKYVYFPGTLNYVDKIYHKLFLFDQDFNLLKSFHVLNNNGVATSNVKDRIYGIFPQDGSFDVLWAEGYYNAVYQGLGYFSKYNNDLELQKVDSLKAQINYFEINPCGNYYVEFDFRQAGGKSGSYTYGRKELNPNLEMINSFQSKSGYADYVVGHNKYSTIASSQPNIVSSYATNGYDGVQFPYNTVFNFSTEYERKIEIPFANFNRITLLSDDKIFMFGEDDGFTFMHFVGCEAEELPDLIITNIEIANEQPQYLNRDTLMVGVEVKNDSNRDVNDSIFVELKFLNQPLFLTNSTAGFSGLEANTTKMVWFDFPLIDVNIDTSINLVAKVDFLNQIDEKYEKNNIILSSLYDIEVCIEGKSCDDGNECTINDKLDENCNCEGEFIGAPCDFTSNCLLDLGRGSVVHLEVKSDTLEVFTHDNDVVNRHLILRTDGIISSETVPVEKQKEFIIEQKNLVKINTQGDTTIIGLVPWTLVQFLYYDQIQKVIKYNDKYYFLGWKQSSLFNDRTSLYVRLCTTDLDLNYLNSTTLSQYEESVSSDDLVFDNEIIDAFVEENSLVTVISKIQKVDNDKVVDYINLSNNKGEIVEFENTNYDKFEYFHLPNKQYLLKTYVKKEITDDTLIEVNYSLVTNDLETIINSSGSDFISNHIVNFSVNSKLNSINNYFYGFGLSSFGIKEIVIGARNNPYLNSVKLPYSPYGLENDSTFFQYQFMAATLPNNIFLFGNDAEGRLKVRVENCNEIDVKPDIIPNNIIINKPVVKKIGLNYKFNLKNNSNRDISHSFAINAYLSKDKTISLDDRIGSSFEQNSLQSNSNSGLINGYMNLDSVDIGSYYLILEADYGQEIDEVNEDNNIVISSQFKIVNNLIANPGDTIMMDTTKKMNIVFDGESNYGKKVGSEFNVYPNPADHTVNIVTNFAENQILILDVNGKEMKSLNGALKYKVDISSFVPGVYFVKYTTPFDTTKFIKFVKN